MSVYHVCLCNEYYEYSHLSTVAFELILIPFRMEIERQSKESRRGTFCICDGSKLTK